MSRRRGARRAPRTVALLCGCVFALGSGATAAQESGRAGDDELVASIEALRPELERTRAAFEAALTRRDSARLAEQAPTVTIRVGPVRVVTTPDQADVARELFSKVWEEHFSGVERSASLEDVAFTFQWRVRLVRIAQDDPRPLHRVEVRRVYQPTRAGIERAIRDALSVQLMQDFDPESRLRSWARYAESDWKQSYAELARLATEDAEALGCLDGAAVACLEVMGLRPPAPEAGRVSEPPVRSVQPTLFWYAVEAGGQGAWARALSAADAEPTDMLRAVSGMESDVLVAGWLATMLDRRRVVTSDLAPAGAKVLLWFLVLGALAMRSTRWRLA